MAEGPQGALLSEGAKDEQVSIRGLWRIRGRAPRDIVK